MIRFALLFSILFSCSSPFKKEAVHSEKPFTILFSHNISGETHPCGCRQFPFGGLAQVAGLFHDVDKNKDRIYVDTGDTLFPSMRLPHSLLHSFTYTAETLINALSELRLDYYVPGDQDFALGFDFIKQVAGDAPFTFLISNLRDKKSLKHKAWVKLEKGDLTIYLVGVVDPAVMGGEFATIFDSPFLGIEAALKEINHDGYDPKNKNERLILLSHSGMETDKKIVTTFSNFDWVIGAHTQSFTTYVPTINKTRLVQVLSKNHYIGEIELNSKEDRFKLHEIRDELKDKFPNNPFFPLIANYKKKLQEIQDKEQRSLSHGTDLTLKKFPPVKSCIECHQKQVTFWTKTPHSISYLSLIKKKESGRPECVTCHALGLNDGRGFLHTKEVVTLSKDRSLYDNELALLALKSGPSIRKLSKNEIQKINKEWANLDKRFEVTANFANVQCLNCHKIEDEHPFSISLISQTKEEKMARCLSCHTSDQTPHWYEKAGKDVSSMIFEAHYKRLSCPKGK